MFRVSGGFLASCTIALTLVAADRAGAQILGCTVKHSGPDTELTSVVVDHGAGPVAYRAEALIGARVTHFKSRHNRNIIFSLGAAGPSGETRCQLLGDLKLTTGVINPGRATVALNRDPLVEGPQADPGMGLEFEQAVVNRPGDDLVLFEIQRGDSPPEGDGFYVAPLRFAPGRRSLRVRTFDVTYSHPAAVDLAPYIPFSFAQAVGSLSEFQSVALRREATPGGFRALAVGIDLSDLGLELGESIGGVFLQDDGATAAQVDPVLVAGFPAPNRTNVLPKIPDYAHREPGRLLKRFLDGPMSEVEEIVFAERVPGNDHWYANFGYYWCGRQEYPEQRLPEDWQPDPIFQPGARLCRLNLRTGKLSVILEDDQGGIRDPQVHYDGQKILFSYRKGGQPHYHLYEIHRDGNRLVQLTRGPFDDIEPAYLPDGGIMFCSSRCNRVVNCWRTPVATLHRCDGDGRNARVVSTNIEHDNTPWVLPDGRVLFMRWEYVDRNQLAFHHLWTVNPDGTGQMVYYGNQHPGTASLDSEPFPVPGKHPGISMLDAKPIPRTKKVVASFSPRHGRPEHMGVITIVDPADGPDDPYAALPVSRPGRLYRDPYPFSEDCFLVAGAEGLQVMDGSGQIEVVYRGPGIGKQQCHEPRPLVAREFVSAAIPVRVAPEVPTGQFVLSDIYEGRNTQGIERGEVKRLLVLEQLPKPVNFSGGPWPLTIGGSFTLSRVLGTVPVEPDGSAFFEAPALRSLFFVGLDENDLSVKRMQSFVSLQPGEVAGCVGCHEHRVKSPPTRIGLQALARPASTIRPLDHVPDVLDFPRDVQPILDRHCVPCHNPDAFEGHVDLTGDHTPLFSQSYWTLTQRGLVADGRNEPYGNRAPRSIGSSASRLMVLIDRHHGDVSLSRTERDTIRLWIESSATYPGTYAALGSGMTPVAFPVQAMERRCGRCHGSAPSTKPVIGTGSYFAFGAAGPPLPLVHEFSDLKQIRGAVGYFKAGRCRPPQSLCNLTRPEKSLLIRAPLTVSAGGLGFCSSDVFVSQEDVDYQLMREAIRSAAGRHQRSKRFDMPGFRPNDHYLVQMRRFGILPRQPETDSPIDCYATDRAYWESFWYRPLAAGAE